MSKMTAKEFDRYYWSKNNPISTPLWKCMQAYADYRLKEYKALQQKESNWISVEDRLPEEEGYYLISNIGGIAVDHFYTYETPSTFGLSDSEITHWQPLPDPPPEKKEEK